MSRPVNPNIPEDGYKSKRQFENTGSIAASDFAVVDDQDNSKEIAFDPSLIETTKTVTIKAGETSDDIVITLPTTSGVLALEGGGGGSPGGDDTQVQFNDTGEFGGDSSFTFDKSSKTVTFNQPTRLIEITDTYATEWWGDVVPSILSPIVESDGYAFAIGTKDIEELSDSSGLLSIETGANTAVVVGGSQSSGGIYIHSGSVLGNATSGEIDITSGLVATGTSGYISIGSAQSSSTGDSGDVSITTGFTTTGTSGNITIRTGSVGAGTRGSINIEAQNITLTAPKTNLTGLLVLPNYIVSGLPSAVSAGLGAKAIVTDATATTFASVVAGTGSNIVPVYSDGTDWRIG